MIPPRELTVGDKVEKPTNLRRRHFLTILIYSFSLCSSRRRSTSRLASFARRRPGSHRRRLAKSRAVERFERFSPRATAATAAPSAARARDARRGRHGGDARGRRRRRGAAARALGGGRTQKPRRRGRAAARGDREGARATVRPRRAGDDDDGDERCANDTNARLCDAGR